MLKPKIILFLFYLGVFSFGITKAQTNLVPNPSFETYTACPVGSDELYKCVSWTSYANSPDYMNTCASPGPMGIPFNWGGYQMAANGNAYSAFATYTGFNSLYREYLGALLTSSLNIGAKYFVSFKVCLSLNSSIQANCASDKMGVKFSSVPFNVFNPTPTNNLAKVFSNTIITDTVNWTRIFGSFVSDSAYKYIMIGNFFDKNNTDTLIMDSGTTCDGAYYYLDDVCVSTDSLFTLQYNTSLNQLQKNESWLLYYPNPFHEVLFLKVNDQVKSPLNVKIYNINSEVVFESDGSRDHELKLELNHLDNGIYFIKIVSEQKIITNKLIKK